MIEQRVTHDELLLVEILRNPVLSTEFIRNFDKIEGIDTQFELTYYQKEMVCDFGSYVSLCCARAVGKTEVLISLITWLLTFDVFPDEYIVYLVPAENNLKPVWNGLIRDFRTNSFLKEFIGKKTGINGSDHTIMLHTGATLMCRIGGQTGTGISVIGLHTPFFICDESGYMAWGVWLELQPTLNTFTSGFRLMVSGVPDGRREKSVCYHCDQENDFYSKHRVTALQNPRFTEADHQKAIIDYNGVDSQDYVHFVCFTADNKVLTRTGYRNIQDISVGDIVLTHSGKWKKVTKTFCRDYTGEVINLRLEGDTNIIQCTPEHPFYGYKTKKVTWSGNSLYALWRGNLRKANRPCKDVLLPDWIAANKLEPLDKVAFPNVRSFLPMPDKIDLLEFGEEENGKVFVRTGARNGKTRKVGHIDRFIPLDELTLFFIGLYIAEGSFCKKRDQGAISLNKNEIVLIARTKSFLDRLGIHYGETISKAGNGYQLTFQSMILKKFVEKYIGLGAKNKHIPEFLLGCNPKELLSLLDGLFAGDGNLQRKESSVRVSYATISEQLILDMAYILRSAGIKPMLYSTEPKMVQICNNPLPSLCQKVYYLELSFTELKSFYQNKVSLLNTFDNGDLAIPIKHKEVTDFSGKVYNLEVEDDNSYVVYGCSVHNCGRHGTQVFALFDRGMLSIEDYPVFKLFIDGLKSGKNITDYYTKLSLLPGISKGQKCIIGIDLGYTESSAFTVFTMDEFDRFRFHIRIELSKVDYQIQERIINYLDTKYNPILIGMDKGAGGQGISVYQHLCNELEYAHKDFNKRLIPIDFSTSIVIGMDEDGKEIKSPTKTTAVGVTQEYANNHKIVFSNKDLDMISELERMVYVRNPSGELVYRTITERGGKGGSDHFTSALLCAMLGYYLENEYLTPRKQKKVLFKVRWNN